MEFDIRKYIWNIFGICSVNHTCIEQALSMLFKNLELEKNRYAGVVDIDRSVFKSWKSLSRCEKKYQQEIANMIIKIRHADLCKAWRNRNREEFDNICFKDFQHI